MRDLVLGAAVLALTSSVPPLLTPASAVESILAGGCSYETLEQCRAFVQGYNGQCVRSPLHVSRESR